MLIIPHDNRCRVLAIDPGNDTLGLAVLDVNIDENTITYVDGITINAKREMLLSHHYLRYRGERRYRQQIIAKRVIKALNYYRPTYIGIETPFMHQHPQAFAALVELFVMLEHVIEDYDISTPLVKVSPRQAKKSVGLLKASEAKEKGAVKVALLNLPILNNEGISNLDEHSIDALAVAYDVAIKLLEGAIYV